MPRRTGTLKVASDLKVANFAKHCESMPLDDLTSLSMQLDYQIYQQNKCIPSLSRFISDLKDMHGDQFMTIPKKRRKVEIIQNHKNVWECIFLALGTGQSYYKFKNTIRLEPYLTVIRNQKQRVSYTKLRLFDHKLRIQTDRHLKFKVARGQRICYLCHTKVEDEIHFLLECPRLVQYHQQRAQCVNAYCKNYYLLTNEEKMTFLMTDENPRTCRAMAKIIHDVFEFRQKNTEKMIKTSAA